MENKIPTAEDFLEIHGKEMQQEVPLGTYVYTYQEMLWMMKRFAKLHVQAALQAAVTGVKRLPPDEEYCKNCYGTSGVLDKNSILSAYPLDKIT